MNMWVFPKIGVPQNGWFIIFIMENPIKMDDLGIPLFLETPMYGWIELFNHLCHRRHHHASCQALPVAMSAFLAPCQAWVFVEVSQRHGRFFLDSGFDVFFPGEWICRIFSLKSKELVRFQGKFRPFWGFLKVGGSEWFLRTQWCLKKHLGELDDSEMMAEMSLSIAKMVASKVGQHEPQSLGWSVK